LRRWEGNVGGIGVKREGMGGFEKNALKRLRSVWEKIRGGEGRDVGKECNMHSF